MYININQDALVKKKNAARLQLTNLCVFADKNKIVAPASKSSNTTNSYK